MKKQFIIPVRVTAYTKEEAQANVDLLLQMGAFLKDFNLNNLAGSFITRYLVAKVSEMVCASKPKVKAGSSAGTPQNIVGLIQKPETPVSSTTKTKQG